jgi:predicted O-methyltransferase YrrM
MPNALPRATEGYTTVVQRFELVSLIRRYNSDAKRIMEIGFNAGHSAEAFLKFSKNVHVTSFDVGTHSYLYQGKAYLDERYPGRHELIIGDSTVTVPQYTGEPFDAIFIDGGHKFPIVQADILNCKRLSHPETIVFLDDTVQTTEWIQHFNKGPNQAWKEAIDTRRMKELGSKDYGKGRGMSWGKYIHE